MVWVVTKYVTAYTHQVVSGIAIVENRPIMHCKLSIQWTLCMPLT